MKRILRLFRDMKFRYKLILTYIFICAVPVLFFGGFSFARVQNESEQRRQDNTRATLQQAGSELDAKLARQESTLRSLVFNSTVIQALNAEYTGYYDMYEKLVVQLGAVVRSVELYNPDTDKILFYSEASEVPVEDYLLPIERIQSSAWKDTVMADGYPHWFSDNNSDVFLAQKIVNLRGENRPNILYLKPDSKALFQPLLDIADEDFGFYILENDTGNILFKKSSANLKSLGMEDILRFQNNTKEAQKAGVSVLSVPLQAQPWTILFYQDTRTESGYAEKMVWYYMETIMAMLLLSIFICWLFMGNMVKQIERLTENMRNMVGSGNQLQITVYSDSKDEIGVLTNAFGEMIHSIKKLMREIGESEEMKREFELKALRSQMNPHFLYNTLSVINWKAMERGADDICEVVQLLSTFYRTALNHGSDMISVENELKNVCSYIQLQQIMHDKKIEVRYSVNPDLKKLQIPCFILQPVVENALLHGIDAEENRDGCIEISCQKESEKLVFAVKDNGCGMTEKQIEKILTTHSNGYGLKNVHERIQLYYGKAYGIKINSAPHVGTEVTLVLPIDDKKCLFAQNTKKQT